jgi:hypothetical protein
MKCLYYKFTGDIFNRLRPRNRVLADVFIPISINLIYIIIYAFILFLGLKKYIVTEFAKLCRTTLCLIPLVRPNAVLSKLIYNFSLSFLPKVQGENTNQKHQILTYFHSRRPCNCLAQTKIKGNNSGSVLTSQSIPAMFLLRPADTQQPTDKHKKT